MEAWHDERAVLTLLARALDDAHLKQRLARGKLQSCQPLLLEPCCCHSAELGERWAIGHAVGGGEVRWLRPSQSLT